MNAWPAGWEFRSSHSPRLGRFIKDERKNKEGGISCWLLLFSMEIWPCLCLVINERNESMFWALSMNIYTPVNCRWNVVELHSVVLCPRRIAHKDSLSQPKVSKLSETTTLSYYSPEILLRAELCPSKFICWSPKPYNFKVRLYLEIGPLRR